MRPVLTLGALLAFAAAAAAQDPIDPRKAEVLNKLNNQRVTLDFKDAPIQDVVSFLAEFTGINFYLDPEIHAKLSEEQLRVTLKVRDLLLKSALKLVLSAKELTGVYKEGVIVIQHRDKLGGSTAMQVYDVRDLLFKLQDFPGPRVELQSNTAGGTALTGATFTLEEPRSVISEDFITDLIKTNTGDRSWDENPNASVTLANGLLIVSQTRKVHEEIKRLLNLLRQFK